MNYTNFPFNLFKKSFVEKHQNHPTYVMIHKGLELCNDDKEKQITFLVDVVQQLIESNESYSKSLAEKLLKEPYMRNFSHDHCNTCGCPISESNGDNMLHGYCDMCYEDFC